MTDAPMGKFFLWFGQYSHTYTYIHAYRMVVHTIETFLLTLWQLFPGTRFETLKLKSGVNEELGRMEQLRSPVEPGRFCHRDNVGLTALFHTPPPSTRLACIYLNPGCTSMETKAAVVWSVAHFFSSIESLFLIHCPLCLPWPTDTAWLLVPHIWYLGGD